MSILSIVKPSVKLVYIGTDTIAKNWFLKGEEAKIYFKVFNPTFGENTFEIYLKPMDDQSKLIRISGFKVKAMENGVHAITLDTGSLEPMLYLLECHLNGRVFNGVSENPRYNFEHYPWLFAVIEERDFSETIYKFGVNIHFITPREVDLGMMKHAGINLIRMDFLWSEVERERGVYNFREYRRLVDALRERNITALFILDYGNQYYDGGVAPYTDTGREAFAKFTLESFREFKGEDVIWELWNEPNLAQFWKPKPNPEDYTRLLKAVHSTAEEIADVKLVAPGISGFDFTFLEETFKLDVLDCVEAVSIHPYRSASPETVSLEYVMLRETLASYGFSSKPIISSEWGYCTSGSYGNRVSITIQAEYAVRMFLVNIMNGVNVSVFYDWKDDGTSIQDSEHNFGIIADYEGLRSVYGRPMYFIKPAYYAIYTLTLQLNGFYFKGRVKTESEDDYVLVFESKQGVEKYVCWTTGYKHKIKLNVNIKILEVVKLYGLKEFYESEDGIYELTLTTSPIFVLPIP
ncbi:cellulase family glycosylhydrolase [Candidatus Bathyarchaeota archaeon]|nr:cellulase family glycosylhydrolase [Candidatus Bathyarchaeota archaeon]